MATQLRLLTFTVLFALAATACSSNAEVQTATQDSAPPALAIADEQEQQAPVIPPTTERIGFLAPTQEELDAARTTFEAWRAVWNSQDIGEHSLTTGQFDDTRIRLSFDSEHNLLAQEVLTPGSVEPEELAQSIDGVFDEASALLQFFEEASPQVLESAELWIGFDSELGFPTRWGAGCDSCITEFNFAEVSVGSQTTRLLTDIKIETDWTVSDLADARATLDAWRAVWDAQGDFAYTLTVGEEGGEQVALFFDAEGMLEQELVVVGDEDALERPRRLRSVDEVFDRISFVIGLFEDGTMNRDDGPFYDVSFDPEFGVPSRFVGGDDASLPVPAIAKVERR